MDASNLVFEGTSLTVEDLLGGLVFGSISRVGRGAWKWVQMRGDF